MANAKYHKMPPGKSYRKKENKCLYQCNLSQFRRDGYGVDEKNPKIWRQTMNHKTLFALAAVVLSCAAVIHAINPASAFPQSPNVSLGSNPISSWSGVFNNDGWYTIDTPAEDFIITDFVLSGFGTYCSVRLTPSQNSTQNPIASAAYNMNNGGLTSFNGHFVSGMKVDAGTTIHAYAQRNSECFYNISGYYTH